MESKPQLLLTMGNHYSKVNHTGEYTMETERLYILVYRNLEAKIAAKLGQKTWDDGTFGVYTTKEHGI